MAPHIIPSALNAADLLEQFDSMMEESMKPIPSGISELDRVLNGGIRDALITLVGSGGSGKTMLAINLARAIARHRPLLYLSFEMTPRMLLTRFISASSVEGGLDNVVTEADLYRTTKPEELNELVETAKSRFAEVARNILILDQTSIADAQQKPLTIETLRRMVERARKETGAAPAVVIDYVQQFVEGADHRTTTTEHLDFLARHLAAMAHHEETPVIVISSAAKDGSIRGSSHLAHGADVILSLKMDPPCAPNISGTITAQIDKNRLGVAGDSIEMQCIPACHYVW